MYEDFDLADPVLAAALNRHDASTHFRRHRLQKLADQVRDGDMAYSDIVPKLFDYISDPATLFHAWCVRERRGRSTPGPDRLRYSDFTGDHRWAVCRQLSKRIRDGKYRSGPEREVRLPKVGGEGTRPIVLTSILDRVVHHAVAGTLVKFVDPKLDPHSCGYRAKRDRRLALAAAELYTFRDGRPFWVTADIRNAFENIPVKRLLDVVRLWFPDDKLIALVGHCLQRPVPGDGSKGLRQGSCLSPLLMNMYFDHFIDKRWRGVHPGVPMLRYADDLLIMAPSRDGARKYFRDLKRLLVSTGLSLKNPRPESSVWDLADGAQVPWLGFSVWKHGELLGMKPNPSKYDDLAGKLKHIHESENPSLRAYRSILGWFDQLGPCYASTRRANVYAKVAAHCLAAGFDEIPDEEEAMGIWKESYQRWRAVKRGVAEAVGIVPAEIV